MNTTSRITQLIDDFLGSRAIHKVLVASAIVTLVVLLGRLPFILSPGLSTDSYAYLDGWPTLEQLAGQGRFGQFLVFKMFGALAIDPLTFATLLQGLGIASFAMSTPLVFAAFSSDQQLRVLPLCVGGLVLALHPYMAELLTFSEASFTALLATAIGIAAIFLVARRSRLWWVSVAMLVAGLSLYQLLINFAGLMILFGVVVTYLRVGSAARPSWVHYRPLLVAAGVVTMALVIYLVLHKLIVTSLGISEVGRASFISPDQLGTRIRDLRALSVFLWERSLLVNYGTAAKFLLWTMALSGWLIASIVLLARRRTDACVPLLAMGLIPLAGLGVVAVGAVWWPAPRILGGIVLVWAMGIYWLAWFARGNLGRVLVAAGAGVLLLAFVAVGHRVHSDQAQLNGFDRLLAQRIYSRLAQVQGYTEQTPVVVVNTRLKWAHPLPLATAYMDLNLTAFADKRAVKGLLELSNGRKLQVVIPEAADVEFCNISASWPDPGFASMQQGRAIVCL